jgi:hypothetical protein
VAKTKEISTGYEPRPLQDVLHRALKRFNVLVCHRRFGKTIFAVNEMLDKALRNKLKRPQYAYIAPTYRQAEMIVWEYILEYTESIPGRKINKQKLTITLELPDGRNIKFMLLGAENPHSLRGIYLDGAVIDEYGECDPTVWGEVIRPTLSDRKGWAIFIGTPKGKNHFYDQYEKAVKNPSWYAAVYRASETGIIPDEELELLKADMNESEYSQEYECSFEAALVGAYYKKEMHKMHIEKRITDVPYDPRFPVDTFWDLGIGDSTAIWFRQNVAGVWRYIDYLEASGEGLRYYAKEVLAKDYVYGRHILPHDGAARDLSSGETRQDTLRKLGIRTEIQPRQKVDDRIQASRMMLSSCYIDEKKCYKGIEALKAYQREWDGKRQIFNPKPKHDWTCHAADAFGYSALDTRKSDFYNMDRKNLPKKAKVDYDIFEV